MTGAIIEGDVLSHDWLNQQTGSVRGMRAKTMICGSIHLHNYHWRDLAWRNTPKDAFRLVYVEIAASDSLKADKVGPGGPCGCSSARTSC